MSSWCWCSSRPDQLVDGDEPAEEVVDCLRYQEIHGHVSFGRGFEKARVQRFAQSDGRCHSWFLVGGSTCHGSTIGGERARVVDSARGS